MPLREMRHLNAKINFKNQETQNKWLNKIKQLEIEYLNNNRRLLELPRSTLMVGDGTYNGEYFPAEEIQKSYKTLDKQPYINDHSDLIKDEVGWWTNPEYNPENKHMTSIPVLNMDITEAKTAFQYIKNRALAGTTAELSAGVYVTPVEEPLNKDKPEGETHIVCRDLNFDHGSNVSRGACSPMDGAGIGLTQNDTDTDILQLKKQILKEINMKKQKLLKMEEKNDR